MRAVKQGALAAMLAICVAGAAQANSLRKDSGPAEYPPASYKSDQYVDSRGCVYIRAGYAGQVSWVPRVTRGRDVMCGFKPTFAKAAPQAAPKATQPAPKAVKPTATKPAPTVRQAKPAPAPKQVVRKPAPQVITTQPAPRKKVVKPAPAQPSNGCPGASDLSQRYINSGSKYPVRCGPQQISPYNDGAMRMVPDGTRQVAAIPQPKIPAGYKPAWKDDRLNPKRGMGTVYGEITMQQVWTETVPRQSVHAGKRIKYVYVQQPGTAAPQAVVSTKSVPVTPKAATIKTRVVAKPAPQTQPQQARARFIQVGSYGDPANAQSAARRLKSMGLPVRVSRSSIKGKPVDVVFAGPMAGSSVNSALGAVRKAGYRDAFVR